MPTQEAAFAGSREKVISEVAFLPLVEEAAAGLLALREEVRHGESREWQRRFVSRLLKEVHHLRSVLNDYEAQENRLFGYFTELVAGIRGFGTVVYILKHLKERFVRSPLKGSLGFEAEFCAETQATLHFCGSTLRSLFAALTEECGRLGIRLPEVEPSDKVNGPAPLSIRQHLPHNLDEEEIGGEGEKVAQVAAGFLRCVEFYESFRPRRIEGLAELREFVLGRLDEERARRLESQMHAIQSKYDTYIQYTKSEAADPDLKRLRGIISLSLHLLEITTHLVHFYERHENDIRSAEAKERLAAVVDKAGVLDRAVNFSFRGAGWFLAEGRAICERLIPAYTSIREVSFTIPDDIRLHIRPAALIAAIVGHHGTPVKMRMGGNECDAESVTEVIFLAGSNPEAKEVVFKGDTRPLEDLKVLFEHGLRDHEHSRLSGLLPYLRKS